MADVFQRITTYNRSSFDAAESLCIFLNRSAYPFRYEDLIPQFIRPVSKLCTILSYIQDHSYGNHVHLLHLFYQPWFAPDKLEYFAHKIHEKSA